jgi:hypothetical protein
MSASCSCGWGGRGGVSPRPSGLPWHTVWTTPSTRAGVPVDRQVAASDLGRCGGAGDGNRTRTVSLGTKQRASIGCPRQRTVRVRIARWCPSEATSNGTPMARQWHGSDRCPAKWAKIAFDRRSTSCSWQGPGASVAAGVDQPVAPGPGYGYTNERLPSSGGCGDEGTRTPRPRAPQRSPAIGRIGVLTWATLLTGSRHLTCVSALGCAGSVPVDHDGRDPSDHCLAKIASFVGRCR